MSVFTNDSAVLNFLYTVVTVRTLVQYSKMSMAQSKQILCLSLFVWTHSFHYSLSLWHRIPLLRTIVHVRHCTVLYIVHYVQSRVLYWGRGSRLQAGVLNSTVATTNIGATSSDTLFFQYGFSLPFHKSFTSAQDTVL